jgi:hypothetical protein
MSRCFFVLFVCYSGMIFPSGVAANSYKKAVDSAIQQLRSQEANRGVADITRVTEPPSYALVWLFLVFSTLPKSALSYLRFYYY